jgi:hypothetical protein
MSSVHSGLDDRPATRQGAFAAERARGGLTRIGVAVVLTIVAFIHVRVYQDHPYKPVAPNTGWENFWDQGLYLKSAKALARGDFAADQHWYPIGYPLLGAPFVDLVPLDPFRLVNLGCLLLFAGAFLAYFRPLIGLLPSAAAFIASIAIPTSSLVAPNAPNYPLWVQFVMPWNTIPIAAIYMCLLCLMRERAGDPGQVGTRNRRTDVALGALAAAVVVIRPTDALALIPLGLVYLWRRVRGGRPLLHIGWAAVAAAIVLLPVALVTWHIHGGLASRYVAEAAAIGMSLSDVHERAVAILLTAASTFGEVGTAVFELQPWQYLAFPLALVWAARDARFGLVPVMTAMASLFVYLSFNDFWPFNVMRFSLIHYIVWLLPVMSAAGLAGVVLLVRRREWTTLGAAAAVALALACYRVEPRLVVAEAIGVTADGPSTTYTLSFDRPVELDAIDIAGATGSHPVNLTWEQIRLVADGLALERFRGYRLIGVNGGIRITFNRHVFAERLEFDLTSAIGNHPQDTALVRPLWFEGTFAPFWRPRRIAAID